MRSAAFAASLAAALAPARLRGNLEWVAFAGGQLLPGTWHEFMAQAKALLGGRVFDGKYMAEHSGGPDLCAAA